MLTNDAPWSMTTRATAWSSTNPWPASGVRRALGGRLSSGAFAVFAARPAARPAFAFLEFLLGATDTARPGRLLFGILDPADELVSGQRRDVVPSAQRHGIGDQRLAQVGGQLVHHPTGYAPAAHRPAKCALSSCNSSRRNVIGVVAGISPAAITARVTGESARNSFSTSSSLSVSSADKDSASVVDSM